MKFFIDNIWAVALAIASGRGLLIPALMNTGKRATPQQVVQLINRGKTVLVDVRTAEEFATGHVRDAKNIPLADFDKRVGELDKSKSKSIVVICQTGARTGKAMRILAAAGFADVVSLDGGLAAWQAASLPVAK